MPRPHAHRLYNGRFSELNGLYMVTVVTEQRQPYFTGWRIGRLVAKQLRALDDEGATLTFAWVVMPDHFHWLVQLKEAHLADVVRKVKARSSLAVNRALGRSGRFWQKGYYDQAVRCESSLEEWVRYIVRNPVEAGLVETEGDYPLWDTCCGWGVS